VGSLFKRICSNWKINLQVHSILEKILYRTKEKIKTSKRSKKAVNAQTGVYNANKEEKIKLFLTG
jgi:hypothetical protein